ncbi:beta-ketoacyl-ACP reductase [Desulfosarcina alkanivorans]|jgi:NAD(P)-dependent dehydrogenase (short-subunit alcohol dehydrogenase family)|uniref:Beta-ketoacyl-ACP reductase n=1 Tax=Desulfosarcina alkanivorans TaxID=571177 RepID=A0A5K7YS97_9BACT|nr:3-oxoacyl-ACP reductase FabG [Desulfosarcina alkanivorans]BBO69851.1 beta-ketoacyl-ACP reductase [Desulfosarcina alkanivorans]
MKLRDKVVIITGGSGGIGMCTCEQLASEGAKIVIADINIEAAVALEDRLNQLGYEAKSIGLNVNEFDETQKLFRFTIDAYGRVDVLVNIAGGSAGVFLNTAHSIFSDSTQERWQEIFNVNLFGTMNCIRSVINHMINRQTGKIINFASIAGIIGMQKAAEYSAAKSGIVGLTKAIAKEVGPHGINVNCISPGVIGTERIHNMPKKMVEDWRAGIPLGRIGQPGEIAKMVAFLASDDANYITGANIPVDGGLTLNPNF